jgi:hypothetical protein
VGANPLSCGGVNHTGGWRTFATARAQHFLAAGKSDVLSDARLIVGRIHHLPDHSLNPDQTKSDLEAYEREICRNVKILDEIKKRLWPNGCSHFSLITKKTNSRVRVGEIVLNFWEKQSEMNMGKISAKIISGADSDMNFRFAKLLEDVSKTWQARDIALVQDLVSHSEYGEAMECLLAVGNNGKGFTKGQSATLVEICKALGVEIPPTKPAPSRPSVLPPIDLTS